MDEISKRQLIKVAWMIFWRLHVPFLFMDYSFTTLLALLLGSVATSAVFVLGAKRSLTIFPVARLIAGKPVIRRLSYYENKQLTKKYDGPPPRYGDTTAVGSTGPATKAPAGPLIDRATTPGKKTGFEPRELEKLSLQKSPWIIGNPGFGLNASNFGEDAIAAGQKGETNFAKALQKTKLIDKFQSYWSVYLPERDVFVRHKTLETDIDCILFNGETIYLIDLKNYKGGGLTYYNNTQGLFALDDATNQPVKVSPKMSKNMSMAKDLYQKHLGRYYKIEARIVLMPQNNGEARIKNVFWPGGIPAVTLSDFLGELKAANNFVNRDHSFFQKGIARMVK